LGSHSQAGPDPGASGARAGGKKFKPPPENNPHRLLAQPPGSAGTGEVPRGHQGAKKDSDAGEVVVVGERQGAAKTKKRKREEEEEAQKRLRQASSLDGGAVAVGERQGGGTPPGRATGPVGCPTEKRKREEEEAARKRLRQTQAPPPGSGAVKKKPSQLEGSTPPGRATGPVGCSAAKRAREEEAAVASKRLRPAPPSRGGATTEPVARAPLSQGPVGPLELAAPTPPATKAGAPPRSDRPTPVTSTGGGEGTCKPWC
jgi:hypothetical protein